MNRKLCSAPSKQSRYQEGIHQKLRLTLHPDYLHHFANFFATAFKYFLQKKSFLTPPNVKNKLKQFWNSYETIENTGEMTDNEILLVFHYSSELWILSSRVPMEKCFWCYFRQPFIYLALPNKAVIYLIQGTRFLSTKNWSCSIFVLGCQLNIRRAYKSHARTFCVRGVFPRRVRVTSQYSLRSTGLKISFLSYIITITTKYFFSPLTRF